MEALSHRILSLFISWIKKKARHRFASPTPTLFPAGTKRGAFWAFNISTANLRCLWSWRLQFVIRGFFIRLESFQVITRSKKTKCLENGWNAFNKYTRPRYESRFLRGTPSFWPVNFPHLLYKPDNLFSLVQTEDPEYCIVPALWPLPFRAQDAELPAKMSHAAAHTPGTKIEIKSSEKLSQITKYCLQVETLCRTTFSYQMIKACTMHFIGNEANLNAACT